MGALITYDLPKRLKEGEEKVILHLQLFQQFQLFY